MSKILKFFRETRGVAAVEFAIVLPFMCVLFFGTNEITQGLLASRKVENVVRIATDLTGQYTSLKTSGDKNDIEEIFIASAQAFAPYPAQKLGVVLTGISIDDKGQAKVSWSFAKNGGAPKACNAVINVPETIKPPLGTAGFIIQGSAEYDFVPSTSWIVDKSYRLKDEKFWLARTNGEITLDENQCKS